jgi:DnaJ-class molecular chaperone
MAHADPYDLLGVARDAPQQDIQKAYRRLAKKLHPDLNPGDKDAQRKFQQLSAAYDIVGDEKKRARFDRGEIDASGAEPPQRHYYREYAQAGAGSQRYENAEGFADFSDADDILSAFFSRAGRRGARLRRRPLRRSHFEPPSHRGSGPIHRRRSRACDQSSTPTHSRHTSRTVAMITGPRKRPSNPNV